MRARSLALIGLLMTLSMLVAACGAAPAPTASGPAAAETPDMAGMDHSTMPGMSDAPYDAAFIDGMIVHHEGAIAMARQALEQAERPEIQELAEAIVGAQEAEIAQLRAWRDAWYPGLTDTGGMDMDMGPMEVAAGDTPFEQRFIEAMIPHHEGAIAMARDALQKAERQEIKDLAQAIITAQEGEIAQMREWRQAWYGVGE